MQIILRSESFTRPLCVGLSDDERFALDNFLTVLSPDEVISMEIKDWNGVKLSKKISKFSRLKEIYFIRCHGLVSVPEALSGPDALEVISFTDCADFSSLKGIERCARCRMIRVCRCDGFTGADVDMSGMESIVAVDFSRSSNLGYVDFSKMPPHLAILDLHGASRACFDEAQVLSRPIQSVQIGDYVRCVSGEGFERHSDIVLALRSAISSRSAAGYDD